MKSVAGGVTDLEGHALPVQPPDSDLGLMAVWTASVAFFGDDTEAAARFMERAADVARWRSRMPPHVVPLWGRAREERARQHAEIVEVWWRGCAAKQREHLIEKK